ncbi:hypothetical protein Tco_1213756 [Tanacetum coccineum]
MQPQPRPKRSAIQRTATANVQHIVCTIQFHAAGLQVAQTTILPHATTHQQYNTAGILQQTRKYLSMVESSKATMVESSKATEKDYRKLLVTDEMEKHDKGKGKEPDLDDVDLQNRIKKLEVDFGRILKAKEAELDQAGE